MVILIPIVVATLSAYFFWQNRFQPVEGRELAQPVVTLEKRGQTVEILVWGDNQFFTVTDAEGRILAERFTMKELSAFLPETAEEIGAGLADILAENSSGTKPAVVTPPGKSIAPSGSGTDSPPQ